MTRLSGSHRRMLEHSPYRLEWEPSSSNEYSGDKEDLQQPQNPLLDKLRLVFEFTSLVSQVLHGSLLEDTAALVQR